MQTKIDIVASRSEEIGLTTMIQTYGWMSKCVLVTPSKTPVSYCNGMNDNIQLIILSNLPHVLIFIFNLCLFNTNMSRRDRPPDGPGANGLRGGRNSYSLKTANGNWIEDCGGSKFYKRGFTTDNFQTECQHQQTGRSLTKDAEFGAALPASYSDMRTTTDVFNPPSGPQGNTWESNSQQMMKSTIGARVLQSTNQVPKSNVDPVALEKYRKSWTNDTEESRKMRFQTESRRAGNSGAPAKFVVESVRFLPGCPIAFERFRERLIERFGILAMSSVRSSLGGRCEMSSADFYRMIKDIGVNMSRIEIEQVC